MIDCEYDNYLKWLDEKANTWYKKMFVKFVKKYFPSIITSSYRRWLIRVFINKVSDVSSFTSITNEDIARFAATLNR